MAARTRPAQTFIQRSRNAAPSDKASWHDQEGAGRSRVKRPFFDLTPNELERLAVTLDLSVQRRLAKTR